MPGFLNKGAGEAACLAAGALFSMAVLAHSADATAAEINGAFRGHADGAFANSKAGPASAGLGRAAHKGLGCTGTGGRLRSSSVDSLSAGSGGGIANLGLMRSTVFTEERPARSVVRNSARVDDVNLLGGAIKADGVRAVAKVTTTQSSMSHSAAGSQFAGLKILGDRIAANVAPNTTIRLPGLGTVTLNKVETRGDFEERGGVDVKMIHVEITKANDFSLPIGAEIVVANAVAGFDRTQEGSATVGGSAYVAVGNARVGEAVRNGIGKAGVISFGCGGTDDKVRVRKVAGLSVDNVMSLGEGRTTAFGGPTKSGAVARTTATVEGVRLLGGLVRLGAVRAVATDRLASGARTSSAKGTRVSNVRIAGLPVGDVTGENVRIDVPLVGYIVLNEVIDPPAGSQARLQVNGARLVVELLGGLLPVGSQIIIAHAESTVYP